MKKITFALLFLISFFYNVPAWADVQPLKISDWTEISRELDNTYVYTDPVTGKKETFTDAKWYEADDGEGVLDGCNSLGRNVASASECYICPLFAILYDAANQMSELSFEKMGKSCAIVVLFCSALVIGFKTLQHLSSFKVSNTNKYLEEIVSFSFKILLSYLLLTNERQIYEYFISPVLEAGLEFGSAMLFTTPETYSNCTANISKLQLDRDTALLSVSLFAKLDCFIKAVQSEIALTQAIGNSLMCISRHEAATWYKIWDFSMMFQGAVIWVFAILISLAFAFYLIDATVNLGLVGALMPFLIASWPFSWTKSYTKTGINMFLNTFFSYVFMGIVMSINIQLIGQALTGGNTIESAAKEGEQVTGINAIVQAMNGNDVDALAKLIDIGGGGFLILICCCLFGFKLTQQANSFASSMAGGGISGIGSKIGGMAAAGASSILNRTTAPARQKVKNGIKELAAKGTQSFMRMIGFSKYGGGSKSPNPIKNNPNSPNNSGNHASGNRSNANNVQGRNNAGGIQGAANSAQGGNNAGGGQGAANSAQGGNNAGGGQGADNSAPGGNNAGGGQGATNSAQGGNNAGGGQGATNSAQGGNNVGGPQVSANSAQGRNKSRRGKRAPNKAQDRNNAGGAQVSANSAQGRNDSVTHRDTTSPTMHAGNAAEVTLPPRNDPLKDHNIAQELANERNNE